VSNLLPIKEKSLGGEGKKEIEMGGPPAVGATAIAGELVSVEGL